ncbi:LamG domain-containing protein [Saccharothrix sp. 6-C]|uniref:LamG domain-containing protein n=1 Tax=Saccharothrix sp. 6-C TaxID=2781735 RepID=UPI001916CD54|nr:LamG domain-containing protein [Saccharothrix sp. 6-C]QQQ77416.1 LamG domain-containing protein [Saccharothrix sp. 6-C]
MSTSRAAAGRSRLRTPRFLASLLALSAVAATAVVTASGPDEPVPPSPVTEAPDTGTALAAARVQGTEVESVALRSATRTVFAQPDGTLRAHLSLVPRRVRQGDAWAAVDTSLHVGEKTVAPKAAEVGLGFSRGGADTPLVELTKDGRSFALTWPGTLPEPRVEGRSATYPEVLPGVDLVMAAVGDGYDQFVVVKTPEAARAPELARLRLGMRTSGLTVKADGAGGLDMVDDAGAEVFTVPPSTMWDSKERADTETPRTDLAPVGVELAADSLTLVPDQSLLTDPNTVFPVYVDPAPRTVHKSGWTTVYQNDGDGNVANSTHWNGYNSQGETNWWVTVDPTARSGRAYATSPLLRTRSYFQFDTSFLAGKVVSAAKVNTAYVHAPGCNLSHNHSLHLAGWGVDANTSWNNQPPDRGVINTQAIGSVHGNCSGQKGVSFTNVGPHVNTTGASTYFIGADNESDEWAWRKFNPNDTVMVVEYNGTPGTPTGMHTVPDPAACRWCGGVPYVGDSSITLKAQVSDPDGDQVRAEWDVYDIKEDGTYGKDTRAGGWVPSGSWTSTEVSLVDFDGKTVHWYVRAQDGVASSPYAQHPEAFVVDRTAPVKVPRVDSVVYPEDNRWHGGVSVPGTFSFTADPLDVDVDGFEYGWRGGGWTRIAADELGGTATLPLTPPGDGPRDLMVRSVDRAGNAGPARVYHFYVRPGNGALAQWSMEGNTADTAHLGDRDATTHGATSYVPGAVGSALALGGAGHAEAPNAVRTDESFSVSAWVRLDVVGDSIHTAVSQDGSSICGFCLQYEGTSRRWVFVMPQSDGTPSAGYSFVRSAEEPTPGVWTHLAGVHDAQNKQLKLYVNGVWAGTTPRSVEWNATGVLRIGQSKGGGVLGKEWIGALDEVRVHDRVLSDSEVLAEVRRDGVHVAHWRFEEDPGHPTAPNSVAGGATAHLDGGADFVAERFDGEAVVDSALRFDGTGQATTGGPVVRTDRSFTVSASVTLDDVNSPMTVLSQDGPTASGFALRQSGGRWEFGVAQQGGTSWNVLARSGAMTAVKDTPTHLAGVFDARAKTATLYVDGQQVSVSAAAAQPLWDAPGSFALGRAQASGGHVDFLRGRLDEVRVHSRALAADEVEAIVTLDAGPVRQWRLDGDGADSSGQHVDAEHDPAVDWVSGRNDNSDPKDLAARLRGQAGSELSSGHAVDTSRSFSVAAWARLDQLGGYPTVLSQDGRTTSAFQLQATPEGHWALAMFPEDVNGGGTPHVRAVGPVVQLGMWTHLAATYDATRDQMILYVNGEQAATAAHANAWDHAAGRFRIGRGQRLGAGADHFPGAVDDVEVHSRVLFAGEIRDKAGRDLSLVHKWQLDEAAGGSVGDSVGGGTGTVTGGPTSAPGRVGSALSFDGVDDSVSTTAVPRTDEDFTVSAWVLLPSLQCATTKCKHVAVSQDGSRNSKFRLGVVKDRDHLYGNWLFEMPESDTDSTAVTTAAVSVESSDFGNWVHLLGVYDRSARQVLLYVDGHRVGEGTVTSAWRADGGVQIGRGRVAGQPAERWPGLVDDVRLHTGSLDDDGVLALFKSYPDEAQPAASLPVADAGRWTMKERTGATAADSSGRGNTVTFTGGAGWIGGRTGGGAWLDGSTASGQTAGHVVDTGSSFSVSAWAFRNANTAENRTVVAQDGNRVSSFALQYDAGGKWAVAMPKADEDDPETVTLLSTEPAVLGRWTHLTVVYDHDDKHLRLYVGGVLSAVRVGVTGVDGGGALSVGRHQKNGVKGGYFPGGVDDLRVFDRALSHGEVAAVNRDVVLAPYGVWRFDGGTGVDSTPRGNTVTFTGPTSFVPGVIGDALKLEGSSSGTSTMVGINSRDSFTVSAWARLERDDKPYAVVSQDGVRRSGFVLQYRPESHRWVFAAPAQDSDSAPLVQALSAEPAVTWRWTHLTGIYDHAGGELRLYVDGKFSGSTDFRLWPSDGALAIGRAKDKDGATDQFAGLIDDVRIDQGELADSKVLERATRPAPPAGQLGRYVDERGQHYTGNTAVAPLPGFRYEGILGAPVPSNHANTRVLRSCKSGDDLFTSTSADCEGGTKLADIGSVYTVEPTNVETIAVYRCVAGSDRFDSLTGDCEGATKQQLLGYTLDYAPLARYTSGQYPWDNWSTVQGVTPGYRLEGVLGWVTTAAPGTVPLYSCQSGVDMFSSLDPACEGGTRIASLGRIFATPPAGAPTDELSRCLETGTTNRFDSIGNCEGHQVQQRLGYLLRTPPAVVPTFPAA